MFELLVDFDDGFAVFKEADQLVTPALEFSVVDDVLLALEEDGPSVF